MFWTFRSLPTAPGGPALGCITIPGCEFLTPQDKQQARSVSTQPENPYQIMHDAITGAIDRFPYAVAAFQIVIKEIQDRLRPDA